MRIFHAIAVLACFLALPACDDKVSNTASCGDGFVDPGEECDGDVGEVTCTSLGHYNPLGTLTCRTDCLYDRTGCGGRCGDGVIDDGDGEVCDGANLNQTCEGLGWHGGALGCASDCMGYDSSGCEAAGRCGDGEIQTEFEDCEGDDLNDTACTDLGFYRGTLACGDDCAFDTSACAERCGDGVVQATDGEECDGSDLAEQTCATLGFYQGTLACSACEFDTASCEGSCGDGVVQADREACDGDNLNGETCESNGFYRGTLTCGQCVLLADGCERCGDGVIQTADGERCELGDLGDGTCRDVGRFTGLPSCEPGCQLGPGTCADVLQFGTAQLESSTKLALDGVGNIYYLGYVSGSLHGEPHLGSSDVFLVKFAPDGMRLWTRQFGTITLDQGKGLVLDAAGNAYVTGNTSGAFPGETSAGGLDAFLVKIGPDGAVQWTRQWGAAGDDVANDVGIDGSGNLVVACQTSGALFGEPALGQIDACAIKFDSNGNRLWTRIWGGPDNQSATQIAVHSDGSIFVVGYTTGAVDGQPITFETEYFLSTLSPDGQLQWTRLQGKSLGPPYLFQMTIDAAKNVYVSAYTSQAWDGEPVVGSGDIALLKYDAAGTRLWTRIWGSTAQDSPRAIAIDTDGRVLVTGTTAGDLDGQPRNGFSDVFVSRYSPDGDRQFTRLFGASGSDAPADIVVTPANEFFLAGSTSAAYPGYTLLGTDDLVLQYSPAVP